MNCQGSLDSYFVPKKRVFFILSTGRSGTQTIARALSSLSDCICIHEPAPELVIESSAYRYGEFDSDKLKQILLETRQPQVKGKVYGESNQTLSLIIPVLISAFPSAKFIWLVRNGLDVVSSTVARQWYTGHSANHDFYDDCPPIEKAWIDGRVMGDRCGDVQKEQWEKMNPFARCCWYWSYVNRIIEQDLQEYTPADGYRMIRLEQIDAELPVLIKWLGLDSTTKPEVGHYNRAHYIVYHWTKWMEAERKTFLYWCGPLMDRLYPNWREKSGAFFSKKSKSTNIAVRTSSNDLKERSLYRSKDSENPYCRDFLIYFSPQFSIKPRISVYITSYNQKDYLIEAIESVLTQTWKPYQIIVVDDCSTDHSQDLIASYANRYPGLITPIYHKKNLGVTRSKIDALHAVTGDYVTYLDGDDRFLPTKIEKEINLLLSRPEVQIAYSNNYYITPTGIRTGVWADGEMPPDGYVFQQTFARAFPKRNLYRMELVNYQACKSIGFYDPHITIYEDYDIRIRMTKYFRVAYYNEPLSEIRLHGTGLSSLKATQHLASLDYIFQKNRPLLFDLVSWERKAVQELFEKWVASISDRAAKEISEAYSLKGRNKRLSDDEKLR